MSIDFTLTPELDAIRLRVRRFVEDVVKPGERAIDAALTTDGGRDRKAYLSFLIGMRKSARDAGLWLPHMPAVWGGMGLGHVELAMV